MSLSLLLEKYDVSTEEGLQKALNEIEKEENDVDEALSAALSRATTLEGKLRTASQAYTKLGSVKADAQSAADMVEKTAMLAQDVSAKVRQLDLARSRVAECQQRVHDLIDLQLCSAGVEAALKAHDYETGAAHVARFLSMDPGSVAAARARGAPDPRQAMASAADALKDQLVTKFNEAARRSDEAGVERLFRLFPQIGRAQEGLDLYAKYLANQVDSQIRKTCSMSPTAVEGAFTAAVTRAVELGAAAARRAAANAASAGAPGSLARVLKHIQPVVCAGVRRLFTEMSSGRQMAAAVLSPGAASGSAGASIGKRTPLEVEPVISELAAAHSALRAYQGFIQRTTQADAASLHEAAKIECILAVDKLLDKSDLVRTAQEILAQYLELERYFLEESVNKAIKMSSGAADSSLVDDVFFIARKVIRRAVSTGSVDGTCAALNEAAALLERSVAVTLRRALRQAPPDPLPLPPPGGPRDTIAARMNRDLDAQRQLFLAHMSEAEAGAAWASRLAGEAEAMAAPLLRTPGEKAKLQSCAAGVGAAASSFRAAIEVGLQALRAQLQPRIYAWADALVDPDGDDDDDDLEADALPAALEALATATREALPASTAEAVLLNAVGDLTTRAELRILAHAYDREGGIQVERRARRLASWAGGALSGARERCARLTQAGGLLAIERPQHAQDVMHQPRLPPTRAKDILARRSDFKVEDIKRLKL